MENAQWCYRATRTSVTKVDKENDTVFHRKKEKREQ